MHAYKLLYTNTFIKDNITQPSVWIFRFVFAGNMIVRISRRGARVWQATWVHMRMHALHTSCPAFLTEKKKQKTLKKNKKSAKEKKLF